VLGFELSGDYGVVLPLFIATVIATAVARRSTRDSIYTAELSRRGIPWEGTLAQRLARSVRARDILEKDPLTIDGRSPASAALAMLQTSRARAIYVTGGAAIKVIDLRIAARLAGEESTMTALEVAVPVPSASPDASLLDLSEKLWNVDWGELPVVDAAAPSRLLGIVSRRSILGALDRELLQRDLLYTRVVTFEGTEESADYLELPQSYRVEVIAPPPALIGRAADPCRVRAETGVNIIGVRRANVPDRAGVSPWFEPDGLELQEQDRLLVLGRSEAIEGFRGQKQQPR
jgi:CBS domain-containing protein